MNYAERVARAIVEVSETAGRSFDGSRANETVDDRVANLLRDSEHGPYVANGDPGEWGDDGAVATIYMEQKGGDEDCHPPLDYWGEDQENAMNVANKASGVLRDLWIDFINPAVACVYRT